MLVIAVAVPGWNGGAGFEPIGTYGAEFTGSFDGRGCERLEEEVRTRRK